MLLLLVGSHRYGTCTPLPLHHQPVPGLRT